MLLSVLFLVALTVGESPRPCRIQSVGGTLRCAVPQGYGVRSGDCSGNDIWALYRDHADLSTCASICSSDSTCKAFMFYNNHRCFPKSKTCGTTSKANSLNVFYNKIPVSGSATPAGYEQRPGDCGGNDIWSIHGFVSLSECASRCNSDTNCASFMYFDGRECYPKTKTCAVPSRANPKNVFYDKVPTGYAMRPGDCRNNDIWSIHGFVSLEECATRCNNDASCIAFMFYDGRECYPKTKTCQTTDGANASNFFYDKITYV